MSDEAVPNYQVGDYVAKNTGEARYSGWIVAVYSTRRGAVRYVIEVDPQGFQMICAPALLELVSIA